MSRHEFQRGMPPRTTLTAAWRLLAGLTIALLFAIALASLTAKALGSYHADDNHFAGAAQLILEGHSPYRDFAFFQMPYGPYVMALVLKLPGLTYKYLGLRLVNLAFLVAAVVLLYITCKSITGRAKPAIAATLLYASSEYLVLAAGQLNGYSLSNLLATASFALIVTGRLKPSIAALTSGVLLGCAVGVKLYYLMLAPALFGYALVSLSRGNVRTGLQLAGAWGLGFGIALLPACGFAVRDLQVFIFDNYGYHALNATWRDTTNTGVGMSVAGKVDFLADVLLNPAYLIVGLSMAVFFPSISRVRLRAYWTDRREFHVLLLALASFALMLTAVLFPKPLWPSYFLAPLPFLIFAGASLYALRLGAFSASSRRWEEKLVAVVALVCVVGVPAQLKSIKASAFTQGLATVKIRREGESLRQALEATERPPVFVSFESLYAIEAGLPLHPRFGGSVFGYRIGDLMAPHLRERCRILSPSTVDDFLVAQRPSGIMLGRSKYYEQYVKELGRYAAEQKYELSTADLGGRKLYLKVTHDEK